jgi:hypothetical protein
MYSFYEITICDIVESMRKLMMFDYAVSSLFAIYD